MYSIYSNIFNLFKFIQMYSVYSNLFKLFNSRDLGTNSLRSCLSIFLSDFGANFKYTVRPNEFGTSSEVNLGGSR